MSTIHVFQAWAESNMGVMNWRVEINQVSVDDEIHFRPLPPNSSDLPGGCCFDRCWSEFADTPRCELFKRWSLGWMIGTWQQWPISMKRPGLDLATEALEALVSVFWFIKWDTQWCCFDIWTPKGLDPGLCSTDMLFAWPWTDRSLDWWSWPDMRKQGWFVSIGQGSQRFTGWDRADCWIL